MSAKVISWSVEEPRLSFKPRPALFALVPRYPLGQAPRVKLFAFSLIAFALSAPAVQARLGETEPELIQRFGAGEPRAPFFPGSRHLVFIKQGFVIDVALIDGTSQMELYSLYNQRSDAVLDGDKVRELLGVEDQGHRWSPVATDEDNKWIRDDGAVAFFNRTNQTFSAETRTYLERESAFTHPRQPSLDGF